MFGVERYWAFDGEDIKCKKGGGAGLYLSSSLDAPGSPDHCAKAMALRRIGIKRERRRVLE